MLFTVEEIIRVTKGTLIQGDQSLKVQGVSINSKTLKQGELFIAIKGKRFDGHDFIPEAIKRGAVAVVGSKSSVKCPQKVSVLKVSDTIEALGHLARVYRDRFSIPVVAITGSAGKTTTKEIVAAVLSARFNVLKNTGTENNHIGVPLTLFKLTPSHQIVVLELGTNRFGDIPWLTYVIHPDVAILTNIGESHLELLKSPLGVFKEKFELIKGMSKKGIVIYNEDDKFLRKIPSLTRNKQLITFGIEREADCKAIDIKIIDHRSLEFSVLKKGRFFLQTPVVTNIYNALAAISCGCQFRISHRKINLRIAQFRYPQGRQFIKKIGKNFLIDDTYNSNPVSFRSALDTLKSLQVRGRKILVCADMLELGNHSKDLHQLIGKKVAEANLDLVISFGRSARYITDMASKMNPHLNVFHFPLLDQVHKKLMGYCQKGDVILVKGSRGMHMEKTVNFLVKSFN